MNLTHVFKEVLREREKILQKRKEESKVFKVLNVGGR